MISIINIIAIACLSFLFAKGAEPIQWIKTLCKVDSDAAYINKVQWFFVKLLNCCLCSGFWIGLIITQSLYLACIISVLSELINKYTI